MAEDNATPPAPVTRRRFLAHVAAAAATPSLVALAADAALATGAHAKAPAHAARKHAPPSTVSAPPAATAEPSGFPRPDYAIAKSPAEREALEKQWKQMVDLVQTLRKTEVPVGAEIMTGALAPRRLRREAN